MDYQELTRQAENAIHILLQANPKPGSILVNLSGRGDKDIDYVMEHYGDGSRFFNE